MTTAEPHERRGGNRVSIQTAVYIVPDIREDRIVRHEGPTTIDALTINVSDGGAGLGAEVTPPDGATVILVFLYPGRRNPMVLQGTVVWTKSDGTVTPFQFEVRFSFTSTEQREQWQSFMTLVTNPLSAQ